MFNFTTHFFEQNVYINNALAYKNNQLLTELLNVQQDESLLKYKKLLINSSSNLKLYADISYSTIENYNKISQNTQSVISNITSIFQKFSMFHHIHSYNYVSTQELFDVLNKYEWIWRYDDDSDDFYDKIGKDIYLMEFEPSGIEYGTDDPELLLELASFNDKVESLCEEYITFIDDMLRVKNLYRLFIDEYLHSNKKFLDHTALAEVFTKFITDMKNKNQVFESGDSRFSHTVLTIDDDTFLAETYRFKSVGAFLYHDLFLGIKNNHIPKKCNNCGKYFLIEAGKYTDYCDNPSPQDDAKTCRDVGSRRRYDDKCKTDPIWQTYNRAYKAHYARYMKKKMKISEFEKWSTWAVEWRTKAENEEISFDEYQTEIKK